MKTLATQLNYINFAIRIELNKINGKIINKENINSIDINMNKIDDYTSQLQRIAEKYQEQLK